MTANKTELPDLEPTLEVKGGWYPPRPGSRPHPVKAASVGSTTTSVATDFDGDGDVDIFQ